MINHTPSISTMQTVVQPCAECEARYSALLQEFEQYKKSSEHKYRMLQENYEFGLTEAWKDRDFYSELSASLLKGGRR